MKKERILSYGLSQKLTQDELDQISAAGTAQISGGVTYRVETHTWDVTGDP